MELERMRKDQYYYLSKEDSKLFDEVKDSDKPEHIIIKKLILDKARISMLDHCSSRY